MTDTIVIGGGLFGQIIAAALREVGQSVRVLDNRERLAGSRPAACLMKPSWFSSLGREVYEPSLALLDRLYGVHDLPFHAGVGKVGAGATVHWCDPQKILAPETEHWRVTSVSPGSGGHLVSMTGPGAARGVEQTFARNVVVAAGVWTQTLIPEAVQQGQMGMSILLPDHGLDVGQIRPWAPYKQMVAFNRGDGLWVGDGTAIKSSNWDEAREEAVLGRELRFAEELLGTPDLDFTRLHGVRPYAKGHRPCLLTEYDPGLWAASGGAKNGTLAAGWAAHELVGRLS